MRSGPVILAAERLQVAVQAAFIGDNDVLAAMVNLALTAPARCPSPSPAQRTDDQRFGRDRAADTAARYPTEMPRGAVAQSIPLSDECEEHRNPDSLSAHAPNEVANLTWG